MNRLLFAALIFQLTVYATYAQDSTISNDSLESSEKKWDVTVDMISRYIWRGQSWGGNYIAVQPSFNYKLNEKLTVGVWATTNFKKDYYYEDGITENKGYQEFDFGVSYQLVDFLSVQVWDYYWPTWERMEGVDKGYFNYGPNGVKSVDATLVFDFSDGYQYAFTGAVSTIVVGNDYRYDENEENPKQNFTTYAEIGYIFSNIFNRVSKKTFQNIDLSPVIGAVFNNQAGYYTYADYDKVSLINLAIGASREFDLGKGFMMPVSLTYTHNAADSNTETFGRNFVAAGLSFYY